MPNTNNKSTTILQTTAILTTSTTTLGLLYYLTHKSIQIINKNYGGISGFLRLIWEGDHLPWEIREAVDELERIEMKLLPKERRRLEKVEVAIQVAKLNSVDDDEDGNADDVNNHDNTEDTFNENSLTNQDNGTTVKNINETKPNDPKPRSMEKHQETNTNNNTKHKHYILHQTPSLTKDLSTISYNLDKIASQVDAIQSYSDENVKGQKKKLSNELVKMMELVDGFLAECGIVLS